MKQICFQVNWVNTQAFYYCPFFKCALVYTTTGMGCWFLCTFKNQRQYRYCQSPNHSKHYSKLPLLFTLLLMWCSEVVNSWGLHLCLCIKLLQQLSHLYFFSNVVGSRIKLLEISYIDDSIVCIVKKKVDNRLTNSYVSLLCDKTTDISVTKELGV